MLPTIDGITFLKNIRKSMNIPVIMLTAKDDYADMVLGLELGKVVFIQQHIYMHI